MDIIQVIHSCILYIWLNFLRPLVKGFLRRTTGLCQLQRICYSTSGSSAERVIRIEEALLLSRSVVIKRIRETILWVKHKPPPRLTTYLGYDEQLVDFAVEAICKEKIVKAESHEDFVHGLRVSLSKMFSYRKMVEEAISMAQKHYDPQNSDHEALAVRLWNCIHGTAIKSVAEVDFREIGFQGKDPSTDFRGMGLLGLHQLIFLVERYSATSKSIITSCNHPVKGYPFAITGINLTDLTLTLAKDGRLKVHFYNSNSRHYTIDDLHEVYSRISIAFNKFWQSENPRDVMEFRVIREKFLIKLVAYLDDLDASLTSWTCTNSLEVDI